MMRSHRSIEAVHIMQYILVVEAIHDMAVRDGVPVRTMKVKLNVRPRQVEAELEGLRVKQTKLFHEDLL